MKNCIALCALFFFSSTLPLSDMGLGQTKAVVKERMLNRLQYEMNIIKKLPGAVKRCVKAKGQCSDEDRREISAGMTRISFVITLLAVLVPATYGIYKKYKKRGAMDLSPQKIDVYYLQDGKKVELTEEARGKALGSFTIAITKKNENNLHKLFSYYELSLELLNDLLIYAVKSSTDKIVKVLLSKNANPNQKDQKDETLLSAAITRAVTIPNDFQESEQIVQTLLNNGVHVDEPSGDAQYTPLMQAAGADFQNIVQMLLGKGANKLIKNKTGQTAHDVAIENNASPAVINLVKP